MSEKKPISLAQYKKDKLKMLKRDFHIHLKPEQELHMMELQSEIAVDNFARTLFMNY